MLYLKKKLVLSIIIENQIKQDSVNLYCRFNSNRYEQTLTCVGKVDYENSDQLMSSYRLRIFPKLKQGNPFSSKVKLKKFLEE